MRLSENVFRPILALLCLHSFFTVAGSFGMDLDWSGQFRSEAVMLNNYGPNNYVGTADGYRIQARGSKNARFQTLFMRLRPKLVVNDNVSIKSEWWLGNPITGFYGTDYPGTTRSDQRFYNSTFSGGSSITAQRFWAEFLTDFGTFQVGRAPQHWGLGIIHNSGDGLFDRYQSTGDTYKMIAKFGNFSLIPAHVKYDMGKAVGGTCIGTTCTNPTGGATLSEYMLGLRYENLDEDFEGGVNFIRRIAGAQSESTWINNLSGGMSLTIWDIYMKKKAGRFDFGVEAPVMSGELVGRTYKTFALATELKFRASEGWHLMAKAGRAPGQPNSGSSTTDKWSVFYFHQNYRLGLLMFNYNFANFGGNNNPNATTSQNTVYSIYDNPITNANYLMLGTVFNTDKWRFSTSFITAKANQTAKTGSHFFNSFDRKYSSAVAVADQGDSLGMEWDFGVGMNWDETTSFGLDFGLLWTGDYYEFGNAGVDNAQKTVFGAMASIGVNF